MEPILRRAKDSDLPALRRLLLQVHRVHSDARPDLFTPGGRKYDDGELLEILKDERRPIYVAECEGEVEGYAFCQLEETGGLSGRTDIRTLYVDDLCVDEAARGKGLGRTLLNYAREQARAMGCYNLTLNVWAGNEAALGFYRSLGLKTQKIGLEEIL